MIFKMILYNNFNATHPHPAHIAHQGTQHALSRHTLLTRARYTPSHGTHCSPGHATRSLTAHIAHQGTLHALSRHTLLTRARLQSSKAILTYLSFLRSLNSVYFFLASIPVIAGCISPQNCTHKLYILTKDNLLYIHLLDLSTTGLRTPDCLAEERSPVQNYWTAILQSYSCLAEA